MRPWIHAIAAIWLTLAVRAECAPAGVYSLTVGVDPPGSAYTTTARVYRFRSRYRASIFGVGNTGLSSSSGHFASSVGYIAQSEPNSVIINGGFSGDNLFTADGLLIVDGYIISPISLRQRQPSDMEKKDDIRSKYHLNSVICQDHEGILTAWYTKNFDKSAKSILQRCTSAFQTRPMLADDRDNLISSDELTTGKAAVRTILAWGIESETDDAGALYVIVFQQPIHLFSATEFIISPYGGRFNAELQCGAKMRKSHSGHCKSKGGLGLGDAVNLAGGGNAFLYDHGKLILGNTTFPATSAISLRDGR